MEQKNGLLPIILLITFSLVLSMWVIKNVPMEPPMADREKQAAIDALNLDGFDLESILAEGKPVPGLLPLLSCSTYLPSREVGSNISI